MPSCRCGSVSALPPDNPRSGATTVRRIRQKPADCVFEHFVQQLPFDSGPKQAYFPSIRGYCMKSNRLALFLLILLLGLLLTPMRGFLAHSQSKSRSTIVQDVD